MKKQTLLEKALAAQTGKAQGRIPSDEEIELAFAWLEGKIGITALAKAMNLHATIDGYLPIARAVREAFSRGRVILKK